MKAYVDELEQALGIATPGKTRLQFQLFDFGRRMGITALYPDGQRLAVKVEFGPGWIVAAECAFLERRMRR